MASLTRSGEGKINGAGFARTSGQYRPIPIWLEATQDLTLQRRSIIQDPTLQRRIIIQDPSLQRRSIARVQQVNDSASEQSDGGREEPVNVEASEDFIDGGRGDSVDVGASEDFINGRRGDHGGVEASEDFIKPLWEQFNNGLRNRRDFFQASAWTPRETSPVVTIDIVSFFYKRDSEWETYHPYETLDFRSDEDNPHMLEQDSIYEAVEFNIAPDQGAEDLSITTDKVTVNTSAEDYNEDNLQKTKLNISEEPKLDNKPPHSPSKEDSKGFGKKYLKKKMSTKKSKDCVMT